MGKWQLPVAVATSLTLVGGAPSVVASAYKFPSVSSAPRVLSLSIGQGSILRSLRVVRVTFNVPMDVPSVRFATSLVRATGESPEWKVETPLSAVGTSGGRTVVLGLGQPGRQLAPGAYSLVVGPAVKAASGQVLGYTSVTDFVLAPYRSPWEQVTVSGQRYDIWAATAGPSAPAHPSYDFLENNLGGGVNLGVVPVSTVYSTDARGRLVTSNSLASQLEAYAEEEGWLRAQPASSVSANLTLDPASVTWAIDNGPGSALAGSLYALAKATGQEVTSPPSQSDVDQAEVASELSQGGPPGLWASELASAKAALDMVQMGDKGYVLAQHLTTLVSEGTLSLPGAEAAKALLGVLKAVNGASGFGSSTLQELYQAEWEATEAASEASPLQGIASALPSADAQMAKDISALLHFSLASEQAVIARAAAKYAYNQAYDLGTDLAKQLAADADPLAAAVVYGLDLGFFIASFTGWDQLRAALYQAVEQAEAERAFADGARALLASVQSTAAPTPGQLDGGLLAFRLAYNTMADFYAQCVTTVGLDQWGEAVDQDLSGLEALVGEEPAGDMVPTWRSVEAFSRESASQWLPGISRVDDATLATVGTYYPAVPARQVPVSLCGTVITEPGQYVLSVSSLLTDVNYSYGPDCEVPGLRTLTGLEVAAPGVSLDLNGHAIYMSSSEVALWLAPQASGSMVLNGTIGQNGGGCCFGLGVVDLAPGAVATHLQVSGFDTGLVVARTEGSRFLDNIVTGFGAGVGDYGEGLGTVASGGISLDHVSGATVAHNKLFDNSGSDSAGITLLSSSGNQLEENSVQSLTNGFYVGCNGYLHDPPAHPLTHTTCASSTGNLITGNSVLVGGEDAEGPAIALDSSTARNVVSNNQVDWASPYGNFVLWDYNSCGANTWRGNVVKPDPVPSTWSVKVSNWPCIH